MSEPIALPWGVPQHAGGKPLVIVMVGLPARGKSFLAHRLCQFLRFRGLGVGIFNAGERRRRRVAGQHDASFFDATNEKAKEQREKVAIATLDEGLAFLEHGGDVVIFDATNTTVARRNKVEKHAKSRLACSMLFLESVCKDEDTLNRNLAQKVSQSPDYRDTPFEKAMEDIRARIAKYESVYEPLDEESEPKRSYIKLIDMREKVELYNIRGALQRLVLSFVMSTHIIPRPVWLVRSGACARNAKRGTSKRKTEEGRGGGRRGGGGGGCGGEGSDSLPAHPSTLSSPLSTPSSPPRTLLRSSSFIHPAASLDGPGLEFAKRLREFVASRSKVLLQEFQASIKAGVPMSGSSVPKPGRKERVFEGVGEEGEERVGSSGKEVGWGDGEEEEESGDGGGEGREREKGGGDGGMEVTVLTSTLPRTVGTASMAGLMSSQWSAINPLDTGLTGVPLQNLRVADDDAFLEWSSADNRVTFRFPGGESLADVALRLEPVVLEIERLRRPTLVISHLSTLQVLLAYFRNTKLADAPLIEVPMHSVIELVPRLYGWEETIWSIGPEFDEAGPPAVLKHPDEKAEKGSGDEAEK